MKVSENINEKLDHLLEDGYHNYNNPVPLLARYAELFTAGDSKIKGHCAPIIEEVCIIGVRI